MLRKIVSSGSTREGRSANHEQGLWYNSAGTGHHRTFQRRYARAKAIESLGGLSADVVAAVEHYHGRGVQRTLPLPNLRNVLGLRL
jgi:hypothetical protein